MVSGDTDGHRLTSTFHAWAIRVRVTKNWLGDPERVYFAARYEWVEGEPPKVPPQFEGCLRLLFKTRAQARKAAKQMRWGACDISGHWHSRCYATPVKVKVKVAVEEDEWTRE